MNETQIFRDLEAAADQLVDENAPEATRSADHLRNPVQCNATQTGGLIGGPEEAKNRDIE